MNFTQLRHATALALALTITASLGAATSKPSTRKTATKKSPPVSARSEPVNRKLLLQPAKLNAKAPAVFSVRFETTKGPFVVEVHRDWAPNGADRFYNLVRNGFYDGARFYRVIAGFMAQFGFSGDTAIDTAWKDSSIADDPVKQSNTRGMVSFAMRGPNTRSTQLFINYSDQNNRLDRMGFSPFGKVTSGMEVVDAFYSEYGEGSPMGGGPSQAQIGAEGNAYLTANFPKLDSIKSARIVK